MPKEDAADLIEILQMSETMGDLERRLEDPDQYSTLGKLTRAILEKGNASSPMKMKANDFNRVAESFYRDDLRKSHFMEGFRFLGEDLRRIGKTADGKDNAMRSELKSLLKEQDGSSFIRNVRQDVVVENASTELLQKLSSRLIVSIAFARR